MATAGTALRGRRARLVSRTVRMALISRREPGDAGADAPPVGLQLGLTGTTQTHAAAGAAAPAGTTGLPGQRLTPTAQPRQQVFQLGQLDLRLALLALGVLGEDVEDQRGPVDDLDLGALLQVAQLGRGQLTVADHRVGAGGEHHRAEVVDLAAADVGGRVGPAAPLDQPFEHLRTGGLGQRGQLGEGVLRVGDRALGPDADEDHPLQPQLAVFDLGDVGELGGEARDPSQRLPLRELQLAGGGRRARRRRVT